MAIKETKTIYEAIKQYHDEIIKPKINEIIENATDKDSEILITLQEASDKLSEDLAKEVSIREVAEHNLNVRIDEETLSRITRDIEITNYLNSEITRITKKAEIELEEGLNLEAHKRLSDDIAIREEITAEANLRIAEDDRIYTRLNEEEAARVKADKDNLITLRNEIDGRISAERKRAVEEETRLGIYTDAQIIKLNNKLDKKFTSLFEEEQQARIAADDLEADTRKIKDIELTTAISDEISRATGVENALEVAISAETTTREHSIAVLTDNLNIEASERKTADNILTNDLNTEIINRKDADSALEKKLTDKINTDIASLNAASKEDLINEVATLNATISSKDLVIEGKFNTANTAIDKEIQDRIAAYNIIDKKIDTEIQDRIGADKTLAEDLGHELDQLSAIIYKTQQDLVDEGITRAQAISSIRTENELLLNGVKARLTDVEAKSEASVEIVTDHTNKLQNINLLIPAEANLANKLADKAYVENLIATESSVFIGTFDSFEEIQAIEKVKHNSYAFHKTENGYDRYKYNGDEKVWKFEYSLNNVTFTDEQ
jgi:hypothetical protein